jgi:hypothetical protein
MLNEYACKLCVGMYDRPHFDLSTGVFACPPPAAVLPGVFFGGGHEAKRPATRAPRAAGVCECARAFPEDVYVCARKNTHTYK